MKISKIHMLIIQEITSALPWSATSILAIHPKTPGFNSLFGRGNCMSFSPRIPSFALFRDHGRQVHINADSQDAICSLRFFCEILLSSKQ